MTQLIKFTGTITALTGLAYTVPNGPTLDKRIPLLPRMGNAKSGDLYINAPAIRSAIRHAAADLITDLSGTKPKLPDYFLLALGGIMGAKESDEKKEKGDESERGDSEKEAKANDDKTAGLIRRAAFARAHNPIINLFGTMDHGVPGRLYCAHAINNNGAQTTILRHVRANDFQRDPALVERLDADAISAFADRQSAAAIRSELAAKKKDLEGKLRKVKNDETKEADLRAQIEVVKTEMKNHGEVSLSHPGLGYEMIVPGTTFAHSFILDGVSDLEISLFLLALDRFASMPFLGGHRNHGLGRIKAEWTVAGRGSHERRHLHDLGRVVIDGEFNPLQAEGEIASYLSDTPLREGLANGTLQFTEAALARAKT